MSSPSPLHDLGAADPTARARAILSLSPLNLRDPGVLSAVLVCTEDSADAPPQTVPSRKQDPFASFFGGGPAQAPSYTVGELAADRLVELVPPGTPGTLQALEAYAASRAGKPEALAFVARLLGVVPWQDEAAAVRALLPHLLAADVSLFEALPGLKAGGLDAAIELALAPFARRAVNELLNHPVAGERCYQAVQDALCAGRIQQSAGVLAELLALLAPWPGVALEPARAVRSAHPWAVVFQAFDDPTAHEALALWLREDGEGPVELPGLALRALQSRSPVEGFPLSDFLAWSDGDATLIRRWKATASCVELLLRWFREGWAHGERPERQWEAALLLVEAGLHGPISDELASALAGEDPGRAVPEDAAFVRVLATASPPLPNLEASLVALAERRPDEATALTPALLAGASPAARLALVTRWLEAAEAAPWERQRRRGGIIHLKKPGVKVETLEALLEDVDAHGLSERLLAISPQLLHEEP